MTRDNLGGIPVLSTFTQQCAVAVRGAGVGGGEERGRGAGCGERTQITLAVRAVALPSYCAVLWGYVERLKRPRPLPLLCSSPSPLPPPAVLLPACRCRRGATPPASIPPASGDGSGGCWMTGETCSTMQPMRMLSTMWWSSCTSMAGQCGPGTTHRYEWVKGFMGGVWDVWARGAYRFVQVFIEGSWLYMSTVT